MGTLESCVSLSVEDLNFRTVVYKIHFCCPAVFKGRSLLQFCFTYLPRDGYRSVHVSMVILVLHMVYSLLSSCFKSLAGFKGHFLFAELRLTLVGLLCKRLGLQYGLSCPSLFSFSYLPASWISTIISLLCGYSLYSCGWDSLKVVCLSDTSAVISLPFLNPDQKKNQHFCLCW